MCIRDRVTVTPDGGFNVGREGAPVHGVIHHAAQPNLGYDPVSYTHLRAHETVLDLVCRLLLEKKKKTNIQEHTKKYNNKDKIEHYEKTNDNT